MKYFKILNPYQASKKTLIDNQNLNFLLKKRFSWMKKFTKNKKIIIELGSGNGFIKNFLGSKIITSDIYKHKLIDIEVDMNNLRIPKKYKKKVDIFILNHSLHHSKNPIKLLKKIKEMLNKKGLILINEPEISFIFKVFLKVFNHERWDLDLRNINKKNFWLQNNATGRILFGQKNKNQFIEKNFFIEKNELNECTIFLNSGGNSVNSPHIKLNDFFLNLFDKFDDILIYLFPKIFALNRSVVLKIK